MIRIALLASLLCLVACAGQPIESSHYLLRAPMADETRPLQFSSDYALGSVSIAPYLDQSGLMLETADGTLRAARNHLWAEPLFDAVQNYLRETISAELGQDLPLAQQQADIARINIRIDQLHGTRDGQARLIAYWWLVKGATTGEAYKFAQTRALERDGYAALAEAQAALLSALGEQIGSALRAGTP